MNKSLPDAESPLLIRWNDDSVRRLWKCIDATGEALYRHVTNLYNKQWPTLDQQSWAVVRIRIRSDMIKDVEEDWAGAGKRKAADVEVIHIRDLLCAKTPGNTPKLYLFW